MALLRRIAALALSLAVTGCSPVRHSAVIIAASVPAGAPPPAAVAEVSPLAPVASAPARLAAPALRQAPLVQPPSSVTVTASPVEQPRAPLSIRVMTYNLGLLKIVNPYKADDPGQKPGKSDVVPLVDERAARIPELLASYVKENHVDVLGLEEVWLKPHADKIAAALQQSGYTVFVPVARPPEPEILNSFFDVLLAGKSESMSADIDAMASVPLPSIRVLGSGLLLAVGPGMRMLNPEFHAFRDTGGFERFTTKGMITAELERTGAQPSNRVLSVLAHFQAIATYQGKPYIDNEELAFKSQQDQVHALIQKTMDARKESAMLFGDMNSGVDYLGPEFSRFAQAGYRNAYLEGNPMAQERKEISWDQENPLVKGGEVSEEHSALIDHIFLIDRAAGAGERSLRWSVKEARISMKAAVVPQQSRKEIQATVPLSDHYAVEAWVGL